MQKIDDKASAVPLFLFIITIIVAGALFALFFIEIGFPILDLLQIADSPYKTFILAALRAIPLIVLIVGCISLILAGLKNEQGWYN